MEVWQGLIGVVVTALLTYAGVRKTSGDGKEQSTASTGAEIISQLRQQIDEQHRNSAADRAADRAEYERQTVASQLQHQQQIADYRTEEDRRQAEHNTKMAALEAVLAKAIGDLRIHEDYNSVLRRWINDRQEPPPPPWPEGLSK